MFVYRMSVVQSNSSETEKIAVAFEYKPFFFMVSALCLFLSNLFTYMIKNMDVNKNYNFQNLHILKTL